MEGGGKVGEGGRLAWLLTALSKKGTAAETTGQGADAGRTPSTEPVRQSGSPGREVLRVKEEDAETLYRQPDEGVRGAHLSALPSVRG